MEGKRLVHLGTVIKSVFGLVDDNGDVVRQYHVVPNEGNPLICFGREALLAAFEEMRALRDKLEAEQCQPPTES